MGSRPTCSKLHACPHTHHRLFSHLAIKSWRSTQCHSSNLTAVTDLVDAQQWSTHYVTFEMSESAITHACECSRATHYIINTHHTTAQHDRHYNAKIAELNLPLHNGLHNSKTLDLVASIRWIDVKLRTSAVSGFKLTLYRKIVIVHWNGDKAVRALRIVLFQPTPALSQPIENDGRLCSHARQMGLIYVQPHSSLILVDAMVLNHCNQHDTHVNSKPLL